MEIMAALVVMALLLVAAGIATIVRAEDDPKTPWTKAFLKVHVKIFVYALIAAWLAMWLMNYDVLQPNGFVSVLGIAYLGFSFIKAMMTRVVQDNPAPAKVG